MNRTVAYWVVRPSSLSCFTCGGVCGGDGVVGQSVPLSPVSSLWAALLQDVSSGSRSVPVGVFREVAGCSSR